MTEDFLHYIWKFQQFNKSDLRTDSGEKLEIINVGIHNQDAGPDFLNAQLRIGETRWAGNVEIHSSSDEWEKHQHQKDPAYSNVILHVVFTNNKKVKTEDDRQLPTLSLSGRIDFQSYRVYKSFLASKQKIPCQAHVEQVPEIIKTSSVSKAAVERLELKSTLLSEYLQQSQGNLEEAFYRALAKNFGFKVNAVPFEQLALITPFKIVRSLWHDLLKLEALFLGQAGFLEQLHPQNSYEEKLKIEYGFIAYKYGLQNMPEASWKFMRLRPQNFPSLRIVQFAAFYHRQGVLVQKILEEDDVHMLKNTFNLSLGSGYWYHHYKLQDISKSQTKSLGETSVINILINTIVPFLFAMGKHFGRQGYIDKALQILEGVEAEDNKIIRRFAGFGFKNTTALDSQGLLQLYNFYCSNKKCLNCSVGANILKNNATIH